MFDLFLMDQIEKMPLAPNGFKRNGPVVFCVLDGVGIFKEHAGNAFHLAQPEHMTKYIAEAKANGLYREIRADGAHVGLTEGDMGNSEVGHNALGSGAVYTQGARLVSESIANGSFWETDAWRTTVIETIAAGKAVHMFGLLSDGNVHSHIDQQIALINKCVELGCKRLRFHPLLDGRDVAPDSGLEFIAKLEAALANAREAGCDAVIASGGGRMHLVMDRYESEWAMVERGWNQMVHGVIDNGDVTPDYSGYFTSATEAIELARKLWPAKKDQYNPGFVIVDAEGSPVGKIEDGDAVINTNFRGDRALEISDAFDKEDFTSFKRDAHGPCPKVRYAGMLQYDSDKAIPTTFLVPPPAISNIMSEHTAALGLRSYAIAETHKYGHMYVSFRFPTNTGRSSGTETSSDTLPPTSRSTSRSRASRPR